MEIGFTSKKMKKNCSSGEEMTKAYGGKTAKKLQQRLMELYAARALDEISHLPPARCHEMKGNRAGLFSVDLDHPYRLYFRPDHDPVPQKPDGGMDRAGITRILIVEVWDPHKK